MDYPEPPAEPPDYRYQFEAGKWYVFQHCTDAEEMALEEFHGRCCEITVYGPFDTEDEADEAGLEITKDVGPWYYRLEQK